jgi:hypothetical protein
MDVLRRFFREVWLVDTEFHAPDGEKPRPICLAARELFTGQAVQRWLWDGRDRLPPFSSSPDVLFVAYFASAELGIFLACNWPIPKRIVDLHAEFRLLYSGLKPPCGYKLLGALSAFGLPSMAAAAKEAMRDVAKRGGPFTAEERVKLLTYCQEDTDCLAGLLGKMLPTLDLGRSLLRGRYNVAVARMEAVGVPLDVEGLDTLRSNWGAIQRRLIDRVDTAFGVYEGVTFKTAAFEHYLARHGIPWPPLPSGRPELTSDAFKGMSLAYPQLKPLYDLHVTLGQLKNWKLSVGSDGRNRTLLSPFASKTGRNQPSNSKFIFGPSVWLRSLIRPEPGMALAYVDWSAQEFGIAAALSGDPVMIEDYLSGDPYLNLAKRGGLVPPDATRKTHEAERDQFKTCCGLGAMYGAGEETLALRLAITTARARELLRLHRRSYPQFWRWSDGVQNFAMMFNYLETEFGWRVHVGLDTSPTSLRNFPMQANGAEMLRLACCLATERGIPVCAPVHDALLVGGPADWIEDVVRAAQDAMREASELVLHGFPLRTDAKIVRHPDRYVDKRGVAMWRTVWDIVAELELKKGFTGEPHWEVGGVHR